MIIQNVNSAPPARLVSNDTPQVVATSPAVAEASAQAAPQQPSAEQIKSAVNNINQALQKTNPNLQLSVDSDTKKQIIKFVDTQTGSVIRQYPSEEVVAIARSIDQFMSQHQLQHGLLLNQKA